MDTNLPLAQKTHN